MTQRKQRFFAGLAACMLLLLGVGTTSSTDTLVMPQELVDFAFANGCAPIQNFFNRPGMIAPPYVYGWLPGDKENSAVFWCKKTDKGEKLYRLMFVTLTSPNPVSLTDPKQLGGCPATIEWQSFPAGLSIETRPRLVLNTLHYAATGRPGPSLTVRNAKVLVNYYDGLTEVFFCFRGHWFFDSID